MTAVFCHKATDRTAEAWEQQLVRFPHLEFAISEAAKGIASAVARRAAARRNDPTAPALEQGLDVFHTAMEANRVLARHWRQAEAAWEKAEQADAQVAEAKHQGIDARGPAGPARVAWSQAIASFEKAAHRESAWKRARAALDLFGPDGRLNDRPRATDEIVAAVQDLTGPEWSKVRHFLTDPRSLSFLDRMHRRLKAVEPRPDGREAMAWRWWLRHGRPEPSDPVTELVVRGVARDRPLDAEEQASYERVAAVLRDTFRASSAVECMNSVLRMQQSRHRRMTQPLLDLKRLYWNCRAFRSGPRKDRCPYRALGLELTTDNFWDLLHTDPARVTQKLSTPGNTG
jgi:hypothetical protein